MIKVKQSGKINREFIVKDKEKIKFWNKMAERSGLCNLVKTDVEVIK